MRYISLLEGPSREAIYLFAKKRNITELSLEDYKHPQEDFLAVSDAPSVFVVADGVTLDVEKFLERKKKYPDPSPAGDVAKIFCEAVLESAAAHYPSFAEKSTEKVFREANKKVAEYNQKIEKTDISGNPTGYYAATGSFVVVKDRKAYWTAICDAYVAHFDSTMNLKFMSSGNCRPYAVINGEGYMAEHLERGIFELEDEDRVFVFTDGFEHYVKNKDFLELFKTWDDTLIKRIETFAEKMNPTDPEKYGHERSLIAIAT